MTRVGKGKKIFKTSLSSDLIQEIEGMCKIIQIPRTKFMHFAVTNAIATIKNSDQWKERTTLK